MTAAEFSALLVLATATSFTPGPNTTLSTAIAANLGLRRALRFVSAVPVGWGLLFALCAGGVGSLVVALPLLRGGILVGGVGYLLWLAWRLSGSRSLSNVSAERLNVSFSQGVLLQFLNIKAWMLALSIVAGWVAGRPDATVRFVQVLPVLLAYAFLSNLTYATVGSLLRHWLAGPVVDGVATGTRLLVFNRLMALALVLTAAWMLATGMGLSGASTAGAGA
ncbi:MAG: LysE family transporter [Hydrogenophaga sp.]|jgi:threonine/homoserine/homoserine lactone efflux protein|nr:LysE family transporter [Hydrogenophaga sp.]